MKLIQIDAENADRVAPLVADFRVTNRSPYISRSQADIVTASMAQAKTINPRFAIVLFISVFGGP